MPEASMPRLDAVASSSAAPSATRERQLLRGVIAEALDAQARKRHALEQQLARGADDADADSDDPKLRAKAHRRAQLVPQQLEEVSRSEDRLVALRLRLGERSSGVREALEAMGLGARLANFDVDAAAASQWGRPPDFDGLVVESPRGVPILVGRRSFNDDVLRRVGRGADLLSLIHI